MEGAATELAAVAVEKQGDEMSADQRMYKFLTPQRKGGYSSYRWPEIGVWTHRIPDSESLRICQVGYHVLTSDQLLGSYMQAELYEVEWAGDILRDNEKCAVRQAKLIRKIETWNDWTVRIFAADCAERALPIFERQYPDDKRPRACIQATRDFAEGKITAQKLGAAAAGAADAAWAAGAAGAAWAAGAAGAAAARAAAAGAAGAAAAAAGAAAAGAAGAAEKKWQIEHLKEMLGIS